MFLGRLNVVTMSFLFKLMYIFKAMLIRTSVEAFGNRAQMILKLIWKNKETKRHTFLYLSCWAGWGRPRWQGWDVGRGGGHKPGQRTGHHLGPCRAWAFKARRRLGCFPLRNTRVYFSRSTNIHWASGTIVGTRAGARNKTKPLPWGASGCSVGRQQQTTNLC